MSVTVLPLIAGVPLSVTVISVPPKVGSSSTVKALLASDAAAPRSSLNVRVRVVPVTSNDDTVGDGLVPADVQGAVDLVVASRRR